MAFENLDFLKFFSKISWKLFALGAWKLGQLIGDDEYITWLNKKKKKQFIFSEL